LYRIFVIYLYSIIDYTTFWQNFTDISLKKNCLPVALLLLCLQLPATDEDFPEQNELPPSLSRHHHICVKFPVPFLRSVTLIITFTQILLLLLLGLLIS